MPMFSSLLPYKKMYNIFTAASMPSFRLFEWSRTHSAARTSAFNGKIDLDWHQGVGPMRGVSEF